MPQASRSFVTQLPNPELSVPLVPERAKKVSALAYVAWWIECWP